MDACGPAADLVSLDRADGQIVVEADRIKLLHVVRSRPTRPHPNELATMALTFSGGGYRAQTSLASGEASRARNWPLRPADGDCAGLVQRPGPTHGRADGGCLAAGQPGEPGLAPDQL